MADKITTMADSMTHAAQWLRDNRERIDYHSITVSVAFGGAQVNFWADSEAAFGRIIRAIGGKWEKTPLGTLMVVRQTIHDFTVEININRTLICERVVIGQIEVPETFIQAHVEEKVEWRCRPILPEGMANS